MSLASVLRAVRGIAPVGLGLIVVALLVRAGQLPDNAPPLPTAVSAEALATERRQRIIDHSEQKKGAAEVVAVRLLDHLQTARRQHPLLIPAYRRLAAAKGAPGHWRHYVDPWSKLPGPLQPLRVQMTFAHQDVRAYSRPPDWRPRRPRPRRVAPGHRANRRPRARPHKPRRQFGRDRRMNKTPGVNETRLSLFAPPPAAFTFQVNVPPKASLTFGAGVPANGTRGPVTFEVVVATKKGPPKVLSAVTVRQDRRHQWLDQRVDLSAYGDRRVQLTLRSRGPKGSFAFWSNPVIWARDAAPPGKNVVFILIDTLRADAAGATGAKYPVTPNIDALAKRGVTFTRAFSMSSWTRSSLLGMFTSEHVTRFSPWLNTTFFLNRRFRRQMYKRWPRLLTWHVKDQGYWVEAIGNNFFLPSYTPIGFDRGFDHVTDIRAHIWDTPAITRGALRFLRAHRKRPFFLYLHYDGPHSPYWVPKGYRVRGARPPGGPHDSAFELYLGEARWTDKHLEPVFAELRKLGLHKNTVVVVTGDHGEVFHRAHDYLVGNRTNNRTLHHHGWSVYEEVLHVPLIITAPGLPAGRRVGEPVSHIDLAPTLLELAGLPPMGGAMGRSLVADIKAGRPIRSGHIAAVARWSYGLRKGGWRLIHRYGSGRKLRRPAQPDRVFHVADELYDLKADPHETRNLARAHPERVKAMRAELLSIVLGKGGAKSTTNGPTDPFVKEGVRLSLRLWGGKGHKLRGHLSCQGTVRVRALRGPTSHAAYRTAGQVDLLLENRAGRPAEVELAFAGCPVSDVRLDLKLDGKPLKAQQVVVGPAGLHLMPDPTRLRAALVPALVSRRPPVAQPAEKPRVHLWLGSSYAGDLNLDGGDSSAAKLADQMLRDAGYSKGPSARPRPRPRPRPR